MVTPSTNVHLFAMDFATRLTAARHERGLTQAALVERVGIHVTQIRRYEAGTSAPTLDVLRNIAIALAVTTDHLVFDPDERGPQDTTLRLHLEAIDHLDPDEQAAIRTLIEGTLLRHQARRLAAS